MEDPIRSYIESVVSQAESGDPTVSAGTLPDNYRPAVSGDVPSGRACGNCVFYNEDIVDKDGVGVWCERWSDWVRGDHYCNTWKKAGGEA